MHFSSKLANVTSPHLHFSPRMGWSRSNFAVMYGIKKLVWGLSCGIIYVILCLAVLTQYRSVTVWQADTQTHDDGIFPDARTIHVPQKLIIGLSLTGQNSRPYSEQRIRIGLPLRLSVTWLTLRCLTTFGGVTVSQWFRILRCLGLSGSHVTLNQS